MRIPRMLAKQTTTPANELRSGEHAACKYDTSLQACLGGV